MLRFIISGFQDNALDAFYQLVGFIFALLFAFTLHEFAHGWVAKLNGDPTAQAQGRLTLNPLKHIDPMGFLMLALVGFGWAKPVPVNSNNFRHQKKGIFTVSIAGVSANLILVIVSFALLLLTYYLASVIGLANLAAEAAFYIFVYLFTYSITINATLFAFNLLPIYPLDGFHVVEAFTHHSNKFCVWMRRNGYKLLMGLLLLGIVCDLLTSFTGIAAFSYLDILGWYIYGIQELIMLPINALFGALF